MIARISLLVLFFLLFCPRFGQADAWQGDRNAAVRLIVATQATGSAARLEGGLEFRFAPGWHGYWRNPGEAGFPPSLETSNSRNLAGMEIMWPAPKRINLLGIDSIAYEGGVILPLLFTLAQPGEPLRLRLAVDYLACADLCVPYHADLTLDLPAGLALPTDEAAAIAAAQARTPGPAATAGLSPKSVRIARQNGQWWLNCTLEATPPLQAPDLFLHGLAGVSGGPPLVTRAGNQFRLTSRLTGLPDAGPPAGASLSLTVVDGARAGEFTAPIQLAEQLAAEEEGQALPLMLLLALLGGLILNIMPCVLPVLSLKILALSNHVGGSNRQQRLGLAVTALGIVASFLILALAALALRAGGIALGWGMQFQQPSFLAFMIGALTLFAANSFGWLSVTLPGWLADFGGARARRPMLDALLSGLFATLLATPCSAPFLGAAISFALARGPLEILTIFTAMGGGFAAPYLAASALPGLIRFLLPRPGRWMLWFRPAMGIALLGSALWLISVLTSAQGEAAGKTALLLVIAALSALAAGSLARIPRVCAGSLAMALLALIFWLPGRLASPVSDAQQVDKNWRSFSQAAVTAALAQGKTVLVDVTADWCINCKINKLTVLERPYLAGLLAQGQVIGLRADWTRPDAQIAAYLASFNRYGIPFNVVYGPARPGGMTLPEILSESALRAAVTAATGTEE